MEFVDPKTVSYLYARDNSIISCGWPIKKQCNLQNLMEEIEEVQPAIEENPMEKQLLEVYLRIKPDNFDSRVYELNENLILCHYPDGCQAAKRVRDGDEITRLYTFSDIFSIDSTQTEIFQSIVKHRVLNFINGENCTLLAYGASGSGKTYTVIGTKDQPGIIPRALEYLFVSLPPLGKFPTYKPTANGEKVGVLTKEESRMEASAHHDLLADVTDKKNYTCIYRAMQQRLSNESRATVLKHGNTSVGIWVSFAEIYNECVYDLLTNEHAANRSKLRICNNKGRTYIKGLNNIYVSSAMQAFQLLQFGTDKLKYAETSINQHSSRSHCIFTITLVQAINERDVKFSHFNFCDLAGSERSKKTNNVGKRLVEANNINTSLLTLGRCIEMLRNPTKSNRIPYRESKLTQLFQRALLGQEDIAMVVNINPAVDMFDESFHVLNFSAIASNIIIKAKPKQDELKKNRFSRYCYNIEEAEVPETEVDRLRSTIEDLIQELSKIKLKHLNHNIEVRAEVVAHFRDLMSKDRLKWEQKFREKEEEIECLEDEIESLQRKDKSCESANESVICLDDSRAARAESNAIELFKTQEELQHVRLDLDYLKEEHAQLKTLNEELTERNGELTKTVKELQDTLEDGKELLHEKIEELAKKEATNILLTEQVLALEDALQYKNITPELEESEH